MYFGKILMRCKKDEKYGVLKYYYRLPTQIEILICSNIKHKRYTLGKLKLPATRLNFEAIRSRVIRLSTTKQTYCIGRMLISNKVIFLSKANDTVLP